MAERKIACILAVMLALTTASGEATAQQFEGPYIQLGAGWPIAHHETVSIPGLGDGSVKSTNAYAGALSVGYGLGYGFRGEVEGNFRHDLIPSAGLPAGSQLRASERQYGVFANAYYDLNLGTPYVSPFVGAGIGMQWQRWSDASLVHGDQGLYDGSGDGDRLAYQLIAGLSLPIRPVSGLSLTAEYRYIDRTGNVTAITKVDATAGSASDQQVLLGFRYAFNSGSSQSPSDAYHPQYNGSAILPTGNPAPAPSPAPPAPIARSYIVYFDFDSASLTDAARAIIAQAAASAATGATQITLNAHADTAGKAGYNLALSRHRADAVAGELIRLGVPREEIGVNAQGDTNLAVPTAPGVRNAQNRRVEIVLN